MTAAGMEVKIETINGPVSVLNFELIFHGPDPPGAILFSLWYWGAGDAKVQTLASWTNIDESALEPM